MNFVVPMFAGASLQTRQKSSPLAQSPHFSSNSINARKTLTSDIATFSKTHQDQPHFGGTSQITRAADWDGSEDQALAKEIDADMAMKPEERAALDKAQADIINAHTKHDGGKGSEGQRLSKEIHEDRAHNTIHFSGDSSQKRKRANTSLGASGNQMQREFVTDFRRTAKDDVVQAMGRGDMHLKRGKYQEAYNAFKSADEILKTIEIKKIKIEGLGTLLTEMLNEIEADFGIESSRDPDNQTKKFLDRYIKAAKEFASKRIT